MSLILKSRILEDDLKNEPNQTRIVSKIIYSGGKYIKTYCTGFLNTEGDFSMKISAVCDDNHIEVLGEEIPFSVLEGICKLIIVREVLPYSTPLKLIKSFAEFCRICIFPFLLFLGPEDESRISEMSS